VLLQAEGPGFADDVEVVTGTIEVGLLEQAGELDVDSVDGGGAGAGEMLGGTLFGADLYGFEGRIGIVCG
jgi:hypothetical protein